MPINVIRGLHSLLVQLTHTIHDVIGHDWYRLNQIVNEQEPLKLDFNINQTTTIATRHCNV